MQYNFDNLEITVNNQLFFVSGTMEIDESDGFGDWHEDLKAYNLKLSNVIDEDGDEIFHFDDEIISAIHYKFDTDGEWYDEILTEYKECVA